MPFIISFFIHHALIAQSSSLSVGVLGGTVFAKTPHYKVQHAGFLWGSGLFVSNAINNKFTLNSGVQYTCLYINNMHNGVDYFTNWTNGFETTRVKLSTSIKQQHLEVPLGVNFKLTKSVDIGLGTVFSVLVNSSLNQEAVGEYSIAQYADQDSLLTATIKYVFKKENERSTAMFAKTNFHPYFIIQYAINNRYNLKFLSSFSAIKNPIEYDRLGSYRTIQSQLLLTINLKKP